MSKITVNTIDTINSTTGLTIQTGNSSGPQVIANSSGGITLKANSSLDSIFIAANGNIGVGNTTPVLDFYVNGSGAGAIGTLSDSANIAIDLTTFNNFAVTLNGNRNFDNPATMVLGQSGVIFVSQNSTGGQVPTWGSYWKFSGNTAPSLSVTAGAVDGIVYTVRTSNTIAASVILNIG